MRGPQARETCLSCFSGTRAGDPVCSIGKVSMRRWHRRLGKYCRSPASARGMQTRQSANWSGEQGKLSWAKSGAIARSSEAGRPYRSLLAVLIGDKNTVFNYTARASAHMSQRLAHNSGRITPRPDERIVPGLVEGSGILSHRTLRWRSAARPSCLLRGPDQPARYINKVWKEGGLLALRTVAEAFLGCDWRSRGVPHAVQDLTGSAFCSVVPSNRVRPGQGQKRRGSSVTPLLPAVGNWNDPWPQILPRG
jgi:hypothetical protein